MAGPTEVSQSLVDADYSGHEERLVVGMDVGGPDETVSVAARLDRFGVASMGASVTAAFVAQMNVGLGIGHAGVVDFDCYSEYAPQPRVRPSKKSNREWLGHLGATDKAKDARKRQRDARRKNRRK